MSLYVLREKHFQHMARHLFKRTVINNKHHLSHVHPNKHLFHRFFILFQLLMSYVHQYLLFRRNQISRVFKIFPTSQATKVAIQLIILSMIMMIISIFIMIIIILIMKHHMALKSRALKISLVMLCSVMRHVKLYFNARSSRHYLVLSIAH